MRHRIQHLHRDEQGMSLVFFGAGLIAFICAAMLAIDVGMLMTARAQAQNAADAGALAGVTGLVRNSFTDRSGTGPAVQGAINAAKANGVIGAAPTVTPADVTFPVAPSGASNRVQVDVHRAGANALQTLIASLAGVMTADVHATATAEASPANAMTCVKPFMIPDKWQENAGSATTYDLYDNKGKLLSPHDVYVPGKDCYDGCPDNLNYTGYSSANDMGKVLVLHAGTGDQINPSFYFSWKMPDDIGGNFYRENIANCNQSKMHWDQIIIQEPGDKSGPTVQGIKDLIAKDPNAKWDTVCNCVVGSDPKYTISPRIFPIPLYDPKYYADGKANGRDADFKIANFLGFFAEPPIGNSIPGRITGIVGIVDDTASPAPASTFPVAIRLVK